MEGIVGHIGALYYVDYSVFLAVFAYISAVVANADFIIGIAGELNVVEIVGTPPSNAASSFVGNEAHSDSHDSCFGVETARMLIRCGILTSENL